MVDIITSTGGQEQVTVPSEVFINDAQMMQDGGDLVLTAPNGETVIIQGYFSSIDTPDIISPEGGFLSADLVESFIVPNHAGEYADANQGTMNDVSPAGQMTEVAGDVWVLRADGTRVIAEQGTLIYEGDMIETSEEGAVSMEFADNTTFSISEGARLSVDEYIYNSETQGGSSFFSMLKGAFVYTSGVIGKNDPENVNIETPVGSIGIRGTVVMGKINPAGQDSEITIIDGAIVLSNASGMVELNDSFETASLTSYNEPIQNIGQVDADYLQDSYNFDNNLSTYNSDTYQPIEQNNLEPTDDSQVAPDTNEVETEVIEVEAEAIVSEDTVVNEDNVTEVESVESPNFLVDNMIEYETQQEIEGSTDQFVGYVDDGNILLDSGADVKVDTGSVIDSNVVNANVHAANSAPSLLNFGGFGGDGSVGNPFHIRQLENKGMKIGHIQATDPDGDTISFSLTNITNLTDGVDVSGLINISSNGSVFITQELSNLANTGDVDLVLDFKITDSHSNVTNVTGVHIKVDHLLGAPNFGGSTDDTTLTAAGAGADLVWGGAGQDMITGTNHAGDKLLGGVGSDLFQIGSLNFDFIDGGLLGEAASNVNTSSFASTISNAISGDTVNLLTATSLDLKSGGANVSQFKNIDNFTVSPSTQLFDLNAYGVKEITDYNNILHIWAADGNSGLYTVKFNGEFNIDVVASTATGTFGEDIDVYRSNVGGVNSTVVVHEVTHGDVSIIL